MAVPSGVIVGQSILFLLNVQSTKNKLRSVNPPEPLRASGPEPFITAMRSRGQGSQNPARKCRGGNAVFGLHKAMRADYERLHGPRPADPRLPGGVPHDATRLPMAGPFARPCAGLSFSSGPMARGCYGFWRTPLEKTMNDHPLWQALGRHWKWIALRGVAAVLFGVLAIAWPGIALTVLVIVWGAYAFVDGVFTLIAAASMRESQRPIWPLWLVGALGVLAGLVAFFWPALTALGLLMLIAGWALATGVLQIIAAFRLRRSLANEWWLGLSGALSVLFGVLMIANPGAGAVAVVWVIGAYALFFGVLLILLALRLRKTSTFDA